MTYSQHGEDDFLARLFWTPSRPAGFKRAGFYVDVGCNDPKIGNNTYFFYLLGWRGVCIDPHQAFGEVYMKERPEDVFVGCAIAEHDGDVDIRDIEVFIGRPVEWRLLFRDSPSMAPPLAHPEQADNPLFSFSASSSTRSNFSLCSAAATRLPSSRLEA